MAVRSGVIWWAPIQAESNLVRAKHIEIVWLRLKLQKIFSGLPMPGELTATKTAKEEMA
jgi:hypothetical protein